MKQWNYLQDQFLGLTLSAQKNTKTWTLHVVRVLVFQESVELRFDSATQRKSLIIK